MYSNHKWKRRSIERALGDQLHSAGRYVDCGVRLTVVRRDASGNVLLPGKPPMRALRSHLFGGWVDTAQAKPAPLWPSTNPVQWYCSEEHEDVILWNDPKKLRQLVYGSMGAGKTTAGAMWLWLQVLECHGIKDAVLGVTAPTAPRLDAIKQAIGGTRWNGNGLWPSRWWKYHERSGMLTTAIGPSLQFISTHQTSAKAGSRIQAFNWVRSYNDELQDYFDVDSDIEARGRSAPGGRYKRFASVTAKDDADWRTFRDGIINSPVWRVTTMLGPNSPFIDPSFWEQLKVTMSPRAYARKVLAQDVGPERMVYPSWSREHNLRPIPTIGASDVTAQVLKQRLGTPNRTILAGHDPGRLVDVTELLRVYEVRGEGLVWFVVGELETKQSTTEGHGLELQKMLAHNFACQIRPDEDQVHLRCDPYGSSESRPDKDVYRIFRRLGYDVAAAQYAKTGTGTGQIKVEARIEMLNRLLCDARGKRRLFVACDERRQPVAPRLVQALEHMERDEAGRAEWEKKGEGDLSHYVSALSYALWPFEKESIEGVTRGSTSNSGR